MGWEIACKERVSNRYNRNLGLWLGLEACQCHIGYYQATTVCLNISNVLKDLCIIEILKKIQEDLSNAIWLRLK